MEKLLSCPFCGCDNVKIFYDERQNYHVECYGCNKTVSFHITDQSSMAKAIEIYNRRAEPENKPLTMENGFEISNADGTPIDYDALGKKYKRRLYYCDIDQFYIGEDGQLVLMDDCGSSVSVDRGDYHIEVRKPEQEEK